MGWVEDPRDGHGASAGSVLTIFRPDHTVVWLIGEIDLAVEPELARLATECDRIGDHLVLDTSHVTFCDGALSRFLGRVLPATPVTVRRPTRLVLEHLAVTGLRDLVKLDHPV